MTTDTEWLAVDNTHYRVLSGGYHGRVVGTLTVVEREIAQLFLRLRAGLLHFGDRIVIIARFLAGATYRSVAVSVASIIRLEFN